MEEKDVVEMSPTKDKIKSRSGIQVIARAAAILRTLQGSPEGLTLAEISKKLDLPRSTVQRIVYALDHENLVIAASPSKGVRLGPALISLAAKTRFEISEICRPTMQNLSQDCGETVALSIYSGDKVIFVDQIAGTHELRIQSPIGKSLPIFSSAPGKAIMAVMEKNDLNKLLKQLTFEQITPNSITNWADMEKELERIRQRGVAFDFDENAIGISAVAIAFNLSNGDYASISIPVPTQRFAIQQEMLVEVLKNHCSKLQKIYCHPQ